VQGAEEEGRHHLKGTILAGHGKGERALAGLNSTIRSTRDAEVTAQIGGDPAQSAGIVQGGGEPFGCAQVVEHCPKGAERIAHVEPQIDGLLAPFLTLWEMLYSHERLLEARSGFPQRRARKRLGAGLPGVGHGLVPHLALREVMRQFRVVLLQPVLVQGFDGLSHRPVQGFAALQQETVVGDVLDDGVPENVGGLG